MAGLGSGWWRALVLVGALLASLAGCAHASSETPRAAAGSIDLRHWDFGRDGIAALDGQWLLRRDAFDDPGSEPPRDAKPADVPSTWRAGGGAATGHGTYHLTVQCERRGGMALSLPVQHSAAQWFVNGALVARQGQPGASARGAQGLPVQQLVGLGETACPFRITVHVSNFDAGDGGLVRSVEIGEMEQLVARRERALVRDLLSIGGLLVLGVMPLLFFLGRPQEKSPLHFSFFCLSFALVIGTTGTRVLQPLLAPYGWDLYLHLVFLGWYGINVFFTTYVRSLYPQHVSATATRAIVGWGVLSCVAVLATGSQVFSQLLPPLAAGSVLIGCYLAWRLFKAARAGRRTARVLLAGVVVLAVAAIHDAVDYAHLNRLALLPYGVLLFVAAPAYQMARRFARALRIEERIAIEERERADLLVRSTKAGLLDWDCIRGGIEWSDRLREMLGYPPAAQAPDMPVFRDLLHPDDRDKVHGSFLRQLKDRSVRSGVRVHEPMDYQLRRSGGDYLWIHAEAVSVCDRDGRTLRYICSFLDISDRKLHEEQMRVQVELTRTEQRRLDLVVWGARVGIVDWDGYTHETYYSPRFREIRGFAADADTSGWPDYFRAMIHPDDRERVTTRWVAFIRGKGPEGPLGEYYSPEEYRLLRADGKPVWVQVSGMAVRDERGFVVRWIAAIIDITEHRAQQQALRDSRDQIAAQAALLEDQNEALKENVRLREEVERISRHDIKTPLNSIISVPRLLREEGRLGADVDELLGIVERAGYRILSMVNLSLDLVKMEQGSYVFRPDAVDLEELADKVLADLRLQPRPPRTSCSTSTCGAPTTPGPRSCCATRCWPTW
jgi:PAS domain S-box-containing protein